VLYLVTKKVKRTEMVLCLVKKRIYVEKGKGVILGNGNDVM
jgi:hypothetical protein